ncbi:hypothetical protein LOTGIDRAFT_162492 [Lottia gigantea]|uniref:Ig-like domain-containing protein n=1 Tax=Lottia gigantea TaxID=225164 RepID=V4A770_LOTGI|nr:hypothetical protein LOTGIDRAFT_162492 [Lottia gigantea]ESO92582.1 hypothetical protein LOTGIDRAFT_162492 [Lottia gigantea]
MDYFLLITYFISFIPQFHDFSSNENRRSYILRESWSAYFWTKCKTIEDKIQILPFGSPIWMLENEPFEVACEITRSEETTSPIVDISKDGFPIEHHTGYTVTKTESVKQDKIVLRHTVTKDSTSITDEGRYSCQAGRFDDFKIIKVFSDIVE